MTKLQLNIGDIHVSSKDDITYTCFGLGSCVGVFLQDREQGLSGGAHIMLPTADDNFTGMKRSGFYAADVAVTEMVKRFRQRGGTLTGIRAKITGGSKLKTSGFETGQQIVAKVINELSTHNIHIAALDVGGSVSRTASFSSKTGALIVRHIEPNQYKIF